MPTTSFVGRADELAALQVRLGESRLVTVLGAPGTGKTRLCRELVERERAAGRRTVFCDLTEAEDLISLCGAVARALDVPLGGAGDAAGAARAIGAALSRMGHPLVVLDNFEQVADLAPATVGIWLDDAPAVSFLVTSRQRLGVAGEALFDLGPLALPESAGDPQASEAFQLFVQRARLVRRDFQPDAEESRTVATLVRELDGLPLAIELAAARLRTLSSAQLLSRMAQRFELLSAPGAAGKATTLRGALESSWETLDAAERTTLAECAAFRGGFTLEAAEAVVDLGHDASAPWLLDVLEALVDKSLLTTYAESTSQRRFGMLVSIRELGLDKLVEMGSAREVAVRHARYYLDAGRAWTHALSGADAARSRHLLGLETENLLAIHRRALDHGQGPAALPTALGAALVLAPLLSTQGPFGMLLTLLDAPLLRARDAEGVDERLLARAHDARAVALRYMGRSTEALADAQRAVALAESTGDERLLARVMTTLSVNELVLGDWRESRAHVERALVVHRAAGDASSEGRALAALGDTWFYEDRLDEAHKSYAAALAIHRQLGERAAEGVALSRLASVAMERGDAAAARELYRGSVELHREVGDRRALASTSGYLAILEQEEGDLGAAEQRFRDAIELAREIENRRTEGIFTGYLAGCLLETGRLAEAAET
ncbi:MAG: tetratricopeptide repeat protein [Polyangiaceae bacterium]